MIPFQKNMTLWYCYPQISCLRVCFTMIWFIISTIRWHKFLGKSWTLASYTCNNTTFHIPKYACTYNACEYACTYNMCKYVFREWMFLDSGNIISDEPFCTLESNYGGNVSTTIWLGVQNVSSEWIHIVVQKMTAIFNWAFHTLHHSTSHYFHYMYMTTSISPLCQFTLLGPFLQALSFCLVLFSEASNLQ